jgi:hypothetical protein
MSAKNEMSETKKRSDLKILISDGGSRIRTNGTVSRSGERVVPHHLSNDLQQGGK